MKVNGKIVNSGVLDRSDIATAYIKHIKNISPENRAEAIKELLELVKIVNGGKKPISIHLARDAAEFVWKQEKRI